MATRSIGDVAKTFLGQVEERKALGGIDFFGIPTGFAKVDEWTGGLCADQMWVVAGRSSMGKTAAALDISAHVAGQGRGVLVYSMEMSADRLANRMLARLSGVPAGRIIRGRVNDDELSKVKQAVAALQAMTIAVVDETMTSDQLGDHAKRVAEKAKTPLGLVVVDYLSLLRDESRFGETERVERISNNLRALAREEQLNVPMLVLSQLNREADKREDHRPILSDLRYSGAVEQDADVVLLLYRPAYYEATNDPRAVEDAEIIVAKARDGVSGVTRARFHPELTMWSQPKTSPVAPKSVGALEARVKAGRR